MASLVSRGFELPFLLFPCHDVFVFVFAWVRQYIFYMLVTSSKLFCPKWDNNRVLKQFFWCSESKYWGSRQTQFAGKGCPNPMPPFQDLNTQIDYIVNISKTPELILYFSKAIYFVAKRCIFWVLEFLLWDPSPHRQKTVIAFGIKSSLSTDRIWQLRLPAEGRRM